MQKAEVSTKIDHIDELLDRVEVETNGRQSEANQLVDDSREVRKKYLLSKRQVFTALDESITQVLLEIDALDRSHYSDRRRAAVNRALRLSDSIEQLKANMADISSVRTPVKQTPPVTSTTSPAKVWASTADRVTIQTSITQSPKPAAPATPKKATTLHAAPASTSPEPASPSKAAEPIKHSSPGAPVRKSKSSSSTQPIVSAPAVLLKEQQQPVAKPLVSPAAAPASAIKVAAPAAEVVPSIPATKAKAAVKQQTVPAAESNLPAQTKLPTETPRTMLENNLRQEALDRAEMLQRLDKDSAERQQVTQEKVQASSKISADEQHAEQQRLDAAQKLQQMRQGIRQVGANLRNRRQNQKDSDSTSSLNNFAEQMSSKLSDFKQQMQNRNSKLAETHEDIDGRGVDVDDVFAQLREDERKAKQESEKHDEHLRQLEANRTRQLDQELEEARFAYEVERQAKEQVAAKLKSDAHREHVQRMNEQEETRLKAEQQRREEQAQREQEARAAKIVQQEKEWEKARQEIQKRAVQREAEMEQTRAEAQQRQERRNAEIEKAKEQQRARECAAQEERRRVTEERRAQQAAREEERRQARQQEEADLAQKRAEAKRQQEAREAELARAREERERARAKLKEQLNNDDPFGFNSFRGPRDKEFYKEKIYGAHFDFKKDPGHKHSAGASRPQANWRSAGSYNAADDAKAWERFEHKSLQSISMADIPFPQVRSLLHIDGADFKKLAKRWHPDKFAQAFGSKLCKSQKDEIMEKVKATFQALNDAR